MGELLWTIVGAVVTVGLAAAALVMWTGHQEEQRRAQEATEAAAWAARVDAATTDEALLELRLPWKIDRTLYTQQIDRYYAASRRQQVEKTRLKYETGDAVTQLKVLIDAISAVGSDAVADLVFDGSEILHAIGLTDPMAVQLAYLRAHGEVGRLCSLLSGDANERWVKIVKDLRHRQHWAGGYPDYLVQNFAKFGLEVPA